MIETFWLECLAGPHTTYLYNHIRQNSGIQQVSYAVPHRTLEFKIIVCVPGVFTPVLEKHSSVRRLKLQNDPRQCRNAKS